MHGVLAPFRDPTLLEAHGEQVLELFVSKAPERVWMRWLRASLRVAAHADNVDVFFRLFALYRNDLEFCAGGDAVGELLRTATTHGSATVLLLLSTVERFATAIRGVDVVRRPYSALQFASVGGGAPGLRGGTFQGWEHPWKASTEASRARLSLERLNVAMKGQFQSSWPPEPASARTARGPAARHRGAGGVVVRVAGAAAASRRGCERGVLQGPIRPARGLFQQQRSCRRAPAAAWCRPDLAH